MQKNNLKIKVGHSRAPHSSKWICLRLPSSGFPGFEHQHTIYAFIVKFWTIFPIELRTGRKINKKRPDLVDILKVGNTSLLKSIHIYLGNTSLLKSIHIYSVNTSLLKSIHLYSHEQ